MILFFLFIVYSLRCRRLPPPPHPCLRLGVEHGACSPSQLLCKKHRSVLGPPFDCDAAAVPLCARCSGTGLSILSLDFFCARFFLLHIIILFRPRAEVCMSVWMDYLAQNGGYGFSRITHTSGGSTIHATPYTPSAV